MDEMDPYLDPFEGLDPDRLNTVLDAEIVEGEAIADTPLFERTSDLLAEPHPGPTPFVVEALLTRGGIACLVGAYKVGKTWAVLELAMSIAAGVPALGRFEVEPGRVMLILEESGRAANHRRMDKLSRGRAIHATRLSELYFATNKGFNLSREEWRANLLAEARRIGPKLIVLDPLARIKGGRHRREQPARDRAVLDYMRELRERSGAAVLFVHHVGHSDQGRTRGTSDLESYRESKVSIKEDGDDFEMKADHREAEATDPFNYRLDFDGATDTARLEVIEEAPEDVEADAVKRERLRLACLAVLAEDQPIGRNRLLDAAKDRGISGRTERLRDMLTALAADPESGLDSTRKGYVLSYGPDSREA